ncbi:MAG: recombinase family protein [Marmoricola sp.]
MKTDRSAPSDSDLWATYDARRASEKRIPETSPARLAFYGRCSTEDNQDPETSRLWQLEKARSLIALVDPEAEIVAEFFDIGHSRSLPWKRRPAAQRLLAELENSAREWDAIVVGEGKRCWFGAQFTDVSPIVTNRGVDIYVPELGGRYDPRNSSHYTLMTVTGGMSLAERQSVQDRVRTAMQVQVQQEGRFQGGRPPYGYLAVPYAPHPNSRKAAEGFRLKRLEPDPVTSPVVQRIFHEVLEGASLREIARGLNAEGIACPSAHDPARNPHRHQNGWQVSTVRAIIGNQRYTGFATFGAFKKSETLLDPNDPSWGSKTRLIRNDAPIVRSRDRAHEPLITVADWQQAQAILASRSAGGLAQMAQRERPGRRSHAAYALKGLVRCAICDRKLQADRYNRGSDDPLRPKFVRYRCRSRGLLEGTLAAQQHPNGVEVKQAELLDRLSEWLGALFAPENRESTTNALIAGLEVPSIAEVRAGRDRQRLSDLERRIANLLNLAEAGVDPQTIAARITSLNAEAALLAAAIQSAPLKSTSVSPSVVRGLVDEFAEAADEVFGSNADPGHLYAFFTAVGLEVVYDHVNRVAHAQLSLTPETSQPHTAVETTGGANVRVRGGT